MSLILLNQLPDILTYHQFYALNHLFISLRAALLQRDHLCDDALDAAQCFTAIQQSFFLIKNSVLILNKKAIRKLRASSREMTGKKGQKVSKEKIYPIKTSNTFLFQIEMRVLSSNAAEFKDKDRFSSQLNYL